MAHRIETVTVEAVKGCELAEVAVGKDGVVVIGGDNGQGKSSFLDAICMALGGKRMFSKEPIRDGENEATVTIKLSGESETLPWPCTITRTITRDEITGKISTKVQIMADDGAFAPSPQTILNEVLGGSLSFDPLQFVSQKPAEQVDTLRSIVNLDFTELDEEYDRIYQERTNINRQAKQLDGKLKQTKIHVDVPTEKIDIGELVKELQDADAANAECDQQAMVMQEAERRIEDAEKLTERAEQLYAQKMEELNAWLANEKRTAESMKQQSAAVINANRENPLAKIDTSIIQQKIANAGEINNHWDENQQRLSIIADARAKKAESKAIGVRLKEIDEEKRRLADAVEWPIQGLGFGPQGVVLNSTPISDLSSSEQMNVSVAISMKLSPNFPFAIVREGSNLDEQRLGLMAAIVQNHGGQVFIERVSKGQECSVIMESGRRVR